MARATQHWVPVSLRPDCSLRDVKRTDLIIVPTREFEVDAALKANARCSPGCGGGTRPAPPSLASAPG